MSIHPNQACREDKSRMKPESRKGATSRMYVSPTTSPGLWIRGKRAAPLAVSRPGFWH